MNTQTIAKSVHVDVEYPLEIQPDGDGGTGYELDYTRDGDGGTDAGERPPPLESDATEYWGGDGWGGGCEHHNQYDAS